MTLTLDIPDFVVARMELTERRVLEALASEGYRSRELSQRQVGAMLGMNFWEPEAFLKERGLDYGLTAEDVENDSQTLRSLLAGS